MQYKLFFEWQLIESKILMGSDFSSNRSTKEWKTCIETSMSCYEIRIYRVAENSKFKRLFALPAIQSIQNLQHDTTAFYMNLCINLCAFSLYTRCKYLFIWHVMKHVLVGYSRRKYSTLKFSKCLTYLYNIWLWQIATLLH